jgi:hypothetical protein
VAGVVVESDENLAGLVGHDGGLVVRSCEGANGIEVVEERQEHEFGLIADRPLEQTCTLEPPTTGRPILGFTVYYGIRP